MEGIPFRYHRRTAVGAIVAAVTLTAACGPETGPLPESRNDHLGPRLDPDSELAPGPDGTLVPAYRIYVGASIPDPGSEAFPPDNPGSEAIWSIDATTVTLGTEQEGEPLALLVVTLGDIATTGMDTTVGNVRFAALSTTDVRVGTSEELNARYFELEEGGCGFASGSIVTLEYVDTYTIVASYMCLRMRRVIVRPDAPPELGETVFVTGEFVAMDP